MLTGQDVNNQTTNSYVEKIVTEISILVSTVVIKSCLLLLLGFVVLTLVFRIIFLTRDRKKSENRMKNIIESRLQGSTMNLSENRVATYAVQNEEDILTFRSKLR